MSPFPRNFLNSPYLEKEVNRVLKPGGVLEARLGSIVVSVIH